MEVFKYTSCVAQRTRLGRTKLQESVNGSNSRRKKRSVVVHKKEKELELSDSSSKRDYIKGSRKSVSCSKKYFDELDEIRRSENANRHGVRSSFQNTRVPLSSYICSTYDTIVKGKGWICMDLETEHSFYPDSSDRSFEDEDVEVFSEYEDKIAKKAVKREDTGFEDCKVEKSKRKNLRGANVGSFNTCTNNKSSEVEEIVVSSDSDDVCFISISSDSEKEVSNESELSVESSFDLEDINEENTEELNSKHESKMNKDKGECVEKEALEGKNISVEDPMVEEIVVSSCDDWADIFGSSDDEDKDTGIEEIVISSDDACDELSSCGDGESEDDDELDDSDFAVESKNQKQSTTDDACDEKLSSCGDEESEDADESDDSDFSVESKNRKKSTTEDACDELSNWDSEESEDIDESDDSDIAMKSKNRKQSTKTDAGDELLSCADEESEDADESDDSDFVVESKNQKQSTTDDSCDEELSSCGDEENEDADESHDSDFAVEPKNRKKSTTDNTCDELSNCDDEESEDIDESDDSNLAVKSKNQKQSTKNDSGDELLSFADEESEDADESNDLDFAVDSKNLKKSTKSVDLIIGTSVIEPYSKRTRNNDKKRKNLVSGKESNVNIHGPKDECRDLDERVHKKRSSIAVEKEDPSKRRSDRKRKKLITEREGNDNIHGPKNECPDLDEQVHKKSQSIAVDKEDLTKRRRISAEKSENILNSILDKGEFFQEGEARQPSSGIKGIPLKFRFEDEDEDPRKVEKSEFDLMVDSLFAESEYALKCEEIGFSEHEEAENEKEDEDLKTEENQYILCSKGKHQLYFDEQIGKICLFCKQILLESKDVLPPLVMNIKTGLSERTCCPDRKDIPSPTVDDLMKLFYGEDIDGCWKHELEGTVWDVIPGTRESIYPHQREGFEFLWKSLMGTINVCDLKNSDPNRVGGCIISHAPGTGKTRLTLLFMESFLQLYPYSLPVIIAPASVLLTWEEEFRKWGVKFPFYNLNNLNLVKNKDVSRAEELKKWHEGRSILGVSYNLYEKLAGEKLMKKTGKKNKVKVFVSQAFKKLRKVLLELPGLVVLDEGHTPRNKRSSIWNTIVKINTKKRVILSGTPFQNNFEELYNTLRLVRPDTAEELSKEIDFMDMIKVRKGRRYRNEGIFLSNSNGKVKDAMIERLKMTIAPFVHVHKGSILQESLPGLRDSVVFLNPPELQKVLIDSLEVNKGTFEFEHKVALVSLHPSLLLHSSKLTEKEKSIVTEEELKTLRLKPDEGVKMRFLRKFIPLCLARNEKVLIFSQFKEPLNFIREQLGDILDGDFEKKVLQLDGNTNHGQRQSLIQEFNDPKSKAKIMLASTKCCSEGISLVGASRVILLDVVWNPSVERQAICRAYRLGQKKVVYTYHLITCGTTEWEKYCRQAEKDRFSELVFFSSTCQETGGQKKNGAAFNDVVLDDMVNHPNLKKMFEKIIYQPKEKNLIDSFSMIS